MRISDWSSDVCSSDLPGAPEEEVLELTDVAGGEAPAEDPAIVSDATASATAERLKALSSAMAGPESGSVTLRSEEHTSELQSLMRISSAVFCLKKNNYANTQSHISCNQI